MSEWWTYSLSDFLLFSPRTYYRLFELYNAAIWPAQVVALVLGLCLVVLMLRPPRWSGRVVAGVLAAGWLWVAWFYLLGHYDSINWAASYFAIGFGAQALLLIWAVLRDSLRLRPASDGVGAAGLAIVAYAAVVHPLVGPLLLGRAWTQAEIAGLTPDPTAIAMLGVLTACARAHWLLLLLPLAWCAVGGATLWTMDAPEAAVLPVAGVAALGLAVWKSLARP